MNIILLNFFFLLTTNVLFKATGCVIWEMFCIEGEIDAIFAVFILGEALFMVLDNAAALGLLFWRSTALPLTLLAIIVAGNCGVIFWVVIVAGCCTLTGCWIFVFKVFCLIIFNWLLNNFSYFS